MIFISKKILYFKSIIIIFLSLFSIKYLYTTNKFNFIFNDKIKYLSLFVNDINKNNNIIIFIVSIILKLLFNIELDNPNSIFENLNPLFF